MADRTVEALRAAAGDLRPMNRDHAFRHSDGSYDLDTPPSDGEAEAPELGLDDKKAKPSTQIRD